MNTVIIIYLFLGFVIYKFTRHKNRPPIFGVYQRKTKWFPLKFITFRTVLFIRSILTKLLVIFRVNPSKHERGIALDGPLPLSDNIKAFDAVFFLGAKDGYYFAMGCERRAFNVKNSLFYLAVPKLGLLCNKRIPDTVLFGTSDQDYSSEGIDIQVVEPMKRWRLKFNGEMWSKKDPSTMYLVHFEADWSSEQDYFDYGTDLHISAVARAVARETWSKEHFENMEKHHQNRYEQMGTAKIKINIEGQMPNLELSLPSFRDHGYGDRRDWSLMHRYAFFHIFLEDGTMAAIGVVSQPCTCSTIETGFVSDPSGRLHPVEWCDLELYQHGENGIPPMDHSFTFHAGGKSYRCQVVVKYYNVHYVGWDWEARMVERFVEYDVNGVKGYGISEFHYRYRNGRPNYINKGDPSWFQEARRRYIEDTAT